MSNLYPNSSRSERFNKKAFQNLQKKQKVFAICGNSGKAEQSEQKPTLLKIQSSDGLDRIVSEYFKVSNHVMSLFRKQFNIGIFSEFYTRTYHRDCHHAPRGLQTSGAQ